MSIFGTFLGVIGFGIGIPLGLILGFLVFIYPQPRDVNVSPRIRPLEEFDSNSLLDVLPELPLWVKIPDYERVDWLNSVIIHMWPYLDKAICGLIRTMAAPYFSQYTGKFQIRSIDFESLTLGNLPPLVYGVRAYEVNEKQLVHDFAVRWAGNPNITLTLKFLSLPIKIQLIDLIISATPRITLEPFVPTFPCFGSIMVSLMDKPQIDFGLKLIGGDLMAIPGLYHYAQETIRQQIASLYLWPFTLDIPILDSSIGATKKPAGILLVKVVRANKLLNKDLIGASDPYVKLSLSGERLPSKKTSVKMNNLNPEWNEDLKLTVKDPQTQVLQIQVFDWEKVGQHDKLGMQVVPLKSLIPHEVKVITLNLLKNLNLNDPHNKKPRGTLTLELTFNPFLKENEMHSRVHDEHTTRENDAKQPGNLSMERGGLLIVSVIEAKDVEGKHHTSLYALVLYKGEKKKTKSTRKTRDPRWGEEFQFVLEEAPLEDKIHIEVMSKRRVFGFMKKESLGYADINLTDIVNNGHINEKYSLINSRNGLIHVDIRWREI